MSTKTQLRNRWAVEPGRTIREKILAQVVPHTRTVPLKSLVLYELLDSLPFREEVPNGRDFRGSDCVGGRELDLSDADFSYASHVGSFIRCNLSGCNFGES